MKKDYKIEELNFINLTKKYWKEQLFFYFLATLSSIGSFFISENGIKSLIKKIQNDGNNRFYLTFLGKVIKDFKNNKKDFSIFFSILIFFYFIIVFFHVWFSFYLQNSLKMYIKSILSEKVFNLKNYYDKKRVASLLTYNARVFSESVFYIPNQIYYVIIDFILNFIYLLNISQRNLTNLSILYFIFLVKICIILQYIFYKKELKFQNSMEDEMKNELFLVDNRDLIIKKNSVSNFLNSYNFLLKKSFFDSNDRDLFQSFSFVFPSFYIIKMFAVFVIIFTDKFTPNVISSSLALIDLFDNFKKIIERVKSYPFCISSQKKINDFLLEDERNDYQNNIKISEKIEIISFNNVSFSYNGNDKEALKNLNMVFKIGSINRMDFPNGFGKSTIINLITGLFNVQRGQVIINENYSLNDLDLKSWRDKISYSEHRNLISQENFSTGQKQLIDLENSFKNEDKEVYIFDEADSNLDIENRCYFLKKVEELSKRKLVILVSHLVSKFN